MKTKAATPDDRFVIIMAGGRGERFWPVSREKTPKQLLKLLGDRSFLQQAVDRVLPLVPLKNIFIITNEAQAPEVRKQLPKLPKENVIAEPVGRDTCAAVTLGAALVGRALHDRRHGRAAGGPCHSRGEEVPAGAGATRSTWPAAARRS